MALLLPLLADPDKGFFITRHSAWIFTGFLVWGLWRLFYFDPVTRNDVIGVVYLAAPFLVVIYATVIFYIRVVLLAVFFK